MNKLLAGASILCVVMVIFGINRGFDYSDEGLYVMLADPFQENVAGIFNYDLFFKLVHHSTGYSFSIVELRILRLLSYFAGAWALASFWKNISGEQKIRFEIFWISCLGLFAGYAFLPPTLSYNSLAVVLVCLWLSLLSKEEMWRSTYFFLGLILAVLVYVKVTTALLLFPLSFLILIFWKKLKALSFLLLVLPLILVELSFLALFGENALTRLQEGIPLNTQRTGYNLGLMVKSIAVGGFWIASSGILFFGLGYLKKSKSSFFIAMQIIAGFAIVVISYLTHITDEWNHLALLFVAAFFGFQYGYGNFKPTKTNLWVLLLFLLPFILHFGSNVYWLRIGIHYFVFWILAGLWLFKNLDWEMEIVISLLCIILVFNGIWWHPFNHEKPLWSEKTTWQIGEREKVFLDPELVSILIEISKFKDQQANPRLLAAYRIPGLPWLVGASIPYSPGIWEKTQLDGFFEDKPKAMIYNKLQNLPEGWKFKHSRYLGAYRSDSLQLLWD